VTRDERIVKLTVALKKMLGPYASMLQPADARAFAETIVDVAEDIANEKTGKKS
jgi:hypothetical protein